MADGVVIASDEVIARVDGSLPVCSQFTLGEIEGWEQFLDPKYDPEHWGLRLENQARNDCRANCGTTCVEVIEYRTKGEREELSRMWLYQRVELLDGTLGHDQGTTVQNGIIEETKVGLPAEKRYPYNLYTGNRAQLDRWMTPELFKEALTRRVAKASLAPEWEIAIAHVALGHPIDGASFWPLSFNYEDIGTGKQERVVRQYRGRHGRAGHAYAQAFVVRTPRGELLMKVPNSHGYYFYIAERAYTEMLDRRDNPFGMYQLAGAMDPKQAYYTGQIPWMR